MADFKSNLLHVGRLTDGRTDEMPFSSSYKYFSQVGDGEKETKMPSGAFLGAIPCITRHTSFYRGSFLLDCFYFRNKKLEFIKK